MPCEACAWKSGAQPGMGPDDPMDEVLEHIDLLLDDDQPLVHGGCDIAEPVNGEGLPLKGIEEAVREGWRGRWGRGCALLRWLRTPSRPCRLVGEVR